VQQCRRWTNMRSTPKRGEVRSYLFPPCGGTPTYFFRNTPVRQTRSVTN